MANDDAATLARIATRWQEYREHSYALANFSDVIAIAERALATPPASAETTALRDQLQKALTRGEQVGRTYDLALDACQLADQAHQRAGTLQAERDALAVWWCPDHLRTSLQAPDGSQECVECYVHELQAANGELEQRAEQAEAANEELRQTIREMETSLRHEMDMRREAYVAAEKVKKAEAERDALRTHMAECQDCSAWWEHYQQQAQMEGPR